MLSIPRDSAIRDCVEKLHKERKIWLVTGVAGFIGSHILEVLLSLDQVVIGLDNFSTGKRFNLQDVRNRIDPIKWKNFEFIEGDIRDLDTCRRALSRVDIVLHQAALGSVPRSINKPLQSHEVNATGFLNVLAAAKDAQVERFVYAASSSTYGDHPKLPKQEDVIGRPLSPYAVTKYVNELYADVFARTYGLKSIGLRYFNVFGPRQDPKGAYAAVIPRWILAMLTGVPVIINGDGKTSRDFCYVENVVQANLLSALSGSVTDSHQIFNVAVGQQTSLNQLFELIRERLTPSNPQLAKLRPEYGDFRIGDVRHSLARISKIQEHLGYNPTHDIAQGLDETTPWFEHFVTHAENCLEN